MKYTSVMLAAVVWRWLLVSLVPMAGVWMVHIDGQWSHLVQPSPFSMAINCPASVRVLTSQHVFVMPVCIEFAKIEAINSVLLFVH